MTNDPTVELLRQRVAALEGQLARRRGQWGERSAFLLRAFEDAPIGMALVATNEKIVEANAALCGMLRYNRETLLGKTVIDITHPEDLNVEATPKEQMRDGTSALFVVEKRYVRSDGSVLIGRLSVSALYDASGSPEYFIGQLEDITESKRAERALAENEAKIRALLESTAELFLVVDATGVISFADPNFAVLTARGGDTVLGSHIGAFIVSDDRETATDTLRRAALRPDSTERCQVRLSSWKPEERHFEFVVHNRLDVAELGGLVVVLRDITEDRLVQAQLARARRLDSIGRLAGGVAHDFNNMLSVILTMTSFLKEEMGVSATAQNDVKSIEDAALRARDLTQQLLAVGRRQHGVARPTDVHELIHKNRLLLDRLMGEDAELVYDLVAERHEVMIDPSHLEQVLLNLASNAKDAMPDGGTLRLRTTIREQPGSPGAFFVLEAADTGVGMTPEQIENIFDPFYTTKEHGRGTGLGLATVYGVVHQAGGDIWAESIPGTGSKFTVVLPLSDRAAAAAGPPAAAEPGTGRILVVEDDRSLRRATSRTLERAGYEVESFGDPIEALETVRSGARFDAVVTDVVMPRLSGPELVTALEETVGSLAVVFVSGYARAAQSEIGQHPGFLPKPFTPDDLVATLQAVLAAASRGSR